MARSLPTGAVLFQGFLLVLGFAPASAEGQGRPGGCNAAPASGTWAALYGDDGAETMESVWVTADGGFLLAGWTDSYDDPNGDAWLVKLDPAGAVEWQRTYGGADEDMFIEAEETADGSIVAAGWTRSFGVAESDFWVVRLSPEGDVLWERTYGGPGVEQAWAVEPTADGGFAVAGGTESFGAGGSDYWLLKLDADGDVLWQKTYGGPKADGGGGETDELVVRVIEDRDGNLVLASDTTSFGAGSSDVWLLKVDPAGAVLWEKAYGGADEDSMWSLREVSGGGYMVPGVSVSASPDFSGDLWALRLDRDGEVLWERVYGFEGTWEEALSVEATADGGALFGGFREEGDRDWDLFLVKVDADGAVQWQRKYEYGWDWPNDIRELADGGYVVAGVAWPRDLGEVEDLWVLRLDRDGRLPTTCDFASDIDLTSRASSSTVTPTRATVRDTQAVPRASSAVVRETPATPRYLCQGHPPSPDGPWLEDPDLPGFRAKVRLSAGGAVIAGRRAEPCIAETLCVSGALPDRPEVFVRVPGPKPNGKLWPTLVKFSTSRAEVWIEQVSTGCLQYYDLAPAAPGERILTLDGLADKEGFDPEAAVRLSGERRAVPVANGGAPRGTRVEEPSSEPPPGPWLEDPNLPGFRSKARFTAGDTVIPGQGLEPCIAETLCVSGALASRAEAFVRVVGPKPNGKLWPTLVKFSTSGVEVWIEQVATGEVRYYVLEAVSPGVRFLTLDGLADKGGFDPRPLPPRGRAAPVARE